jgi:hypothetical protein
METKGLANAGFGGRCAKFFILPRAYLWDNLSQQVGAGAFQLC